MFKSGQEVEVSGEKVQVVRVGDGWMKVRNSKGFSRSVRFDRDGVVSETQPMHCMVPQSQRRGR